MRLLRLASVMALIAIASAQQPSEGGGLPGSEAFHWPREGATAFLAYTTDLRVRSSTWAPIVRTGLGAWHDADTGLDPVVSFHNSPTQAVIRIESDDYGATGWIGQAAVSVNTITSHIIDATVSLNEYYFKGTYDNATARLHIACHEIGHALGLSHPDGPATSSCMDHHQATYSKIAYKGPSVEDAEDLAAIYEHRDLGRSHVHPAEPGALAVVPVG